MTHPALVGVPIGMAHRGFTPRGPGRAPHAWENTLAAFEAAASLGLRHVETDCHVSADGVVVLVHDPDLTRTTGTARRVGEMSWAEIARVRGPDGHPVPRLDDVLSALPDTVLNIDCKDPRAAMPLAAAVRAAGAEDRVLVAAFDGRVSLAVQVAAPGVARSLGMRATGAATLAARLSSLSPTASRSLVRAVAGDADALQVPETYGRVRVVTDRLLQVVHDIGLQVHVWTVDDPRDMHRLLDHGVDGLISDRADVLVGVLTERAG